MKIRESAFVDTYIQNPSLHVGCLLFSYSSPRLVIDRMEELIVELLLVENVWCQKQSWSFMNLLCSGMVGFGLGAYCGAVVGGKCMVPKAKLVIYEFAMWWYGRFWSTAKFGDN